MDKLSNYDFVLLDDDELLLKLEKQFLKKLGATNVYTYQSVKELTPEFQLHNTQNTILLCDLKLPDIDGVELIRQLAQQQFQGYIVIVSGTEHRIIDSVVTMAKGLHLKVLGGMQKPIHFPSFSKILQKLQYKEQQEVVRTPYKIDEKKLRTAINNEDIFLVYQPKVRVENAKFVGAEVLARWQHAEYGVIPPLIFIELAEKHGLISDLTYYILNKTFQQLAKWQQHNLLVPVSVNISEADLQYIDLPEHIMTLSHRYDIDPSLITLEITESCLIGDVPQRLEVISRLRLRNIGLSIDDFGTGYSSLEKLRNIPFTELKIDKSFIQYVNSSKDDYNIVKANIELAKVLGLQTVAEGVEEKEQIAILKELGCDIIQGYYYSKPLPADEFEVWLRKHLAIKN